VGSSCALACERIHHVTPEIIGPTHKCCGANALKVTSAHANGLCTDRWQAATVDESAVKMRNTHAGAKMCDASAASLFNTHHVQQVDFPRLQSSEQGWYR
jgi:hypothetical protein